MIFFLQSYDFFGDLRKERTQAEWVNLDRLLLPKDVELTSVVPRTAYGMQTKVRAEGPKIVHGSCAV